MFGKRFSVSVAVLTGLALTCGPVAAANSIVIDSPENGASISQSTTPTVDFAGSVVFSEPEPTTRTLYLRRLQCPGDGFLSDTSGPDDGNSCVTFPQWLLTPLPPEDDYSDSFPSRAAIQTPLTVDASRNVTGEINIRGNTDTPNWQVFDVEVRIGSITLPRQRFDDNTPQLTSSRTLNVDIDIPERLDKTDVERVEVTVYYQQHVGTWVELDNPESFIHVPAFSDSFNREVQVQIDNQPPSPAELDEAFSNWSMTGTTPAIGDHSVTATAVQGGTIRATATHQFSVVS